MDTCPFVGPLIPLFWTSGDVSSGFQSQSGFCLIHAWWRLHNIYSLRFTSGATPLPVYNASIAVSCLPHMHVSAEVGCRDLKCRPPTWQSDMLPTRPRRLATTSKLEIRKKSVFWLGTVVTCLRGHYPLSLHPLYTFFKPF